MPLTAKQAAERIGRKSARTVLRRLIPRYREGREWRYLEADVDDYIRRQTLITSRAARTEAVALPETATQALARLRPDQ